MGKLDDYKKNNPQAFQTQSTGEKKPVINMLLKISGYEIGGAQDKNFVLGERVDTGEQVKVSLYEIQQNENSKYKRVEISEFSDGPRKRKVVPENFMVFEQAREESSGVYSARWAVPLDREVRRTNAFVMLANLRHGVRKNDNGESEWFMIRTLFNIEPIVASNEKEFDAALLKMLKPRRPGSNPQVIVRITDETGEKMTVEVRPLREEVKEDGRTFTRVSSDPQRSIDNFKETDSDNWNMISNFIADSDMKVEIIGSAVLYPGAATKEKWEEMPPRSKEHMIKGFQIQKDEQEENEEEGGNTFPEGGYHFCVIGTRTYEDGTPYLTYIKPLKEYTNATSINDIELFSLKK